ncbi:MAG: hypothetical protein JW955_13075 [Sedimentisphaerales bacterium]|nr:hypothetical protein [Sedimentisphaerales bacterium]
MKRSAIGLRLLRAALLLVVVIGANLLVSRHTLAGDEIENALKEYHEQSGAFRGGQHDPSAKTRFYEMWLPRFITLAETADSPAQREQLLTEAVGLANALEKYSVSQELTAKLRQSQRSWAGQMRWMVEAGEIAENSYKISKSEKDAQAALRHFSDAYNLAKGHEQAVVQSYGLARDYVVAVDKLANLESGINHNHARSADLYASARGLVDSMHPQARRLIETTHSREVLAANEMLSSARAGQVERSYKVLDEVAAVPGARWPGSYYMYQLATVLAPTGDEVFEKEVSQWLSTRPADSWTPFLMFFLANDYKVHGKWTNAAQLYEQLRAQYAEVLLLADEKALEQGRGGYMAQLLYDLCNIYLNLGLKEQAYRAYAELEKLAPQDPRLSVMKRTMDTIALEVYALPEDLGAMGEASSESPIVITDKISDVVAAPMDAATTARPRWALWLSGSGIAVVMVLLIVALLRRGIRQH